MSIMVFYHFIQIFTYPQYFLAIREKKYYNEIRSLSLRRIPREIISAAYILAAIQRLLELGGKMARARTIRRRHRAEPRERLHTRPHQRLVPRLLRRAPSL